MSDTPKNHAQAIALAIANHTPEELAHGFICWEAVKKLPKESVAAMAAIGMDGRSLSVMLGEIIKENK